MDSEILREYTHTIQRRKKENYEMSKIRKQGKSRMAQLHEKSFSWFWGIGGVHQQAKKAFRTYKCTACQLAIFM